MLIIDHSYDVTRLTSLKELSIPSSGSYTEKRIKCI